MVPQALASVPNRCDSRRKDGQPCTNPATGGGAYCFAHDPDREQARAEARTRGGQNSSNAVRLGNLCPPRLVAVFDRLERALEEVHTGTLEPRQASAMASLAGAMTRVLTTGELEQRLRDVEAKTV